MKRAKKEISRRDFIRSIEASAAAVLIFPVLKSCKSADKQNEQAIPVTEDTISQWRSMMKDPVYGMISGQPDLDQIRGLFPKQTGDPAIDPQLVRENMNRIKTFPEVNTGYELLDLSIKTGLAHIDLTFQGDHPKYGIGEYSRVKHDGFPPTIIAVIDALSAWGIHQRAIELFGYWLTRFVKQDGTIDYYGPSVSEYGQLLHTADVLFERAGGEGWWEAGFPKLNLMAEYLLHLHADAAKNDGLISGVPEADTRYEIGKYFHNNAWVVKGLKQWVKVCQLTNSKPSTSIQNILTSADRLKEDTLDSINKTWPADTSDWWLPTRLGEIKRPKNMTDGDEASYTNYRYWLELLSGGILTNDLANRVVNARLNGGGQFCGMTRFRDWLDDWPLAEYLYALWDLGRKDDFLLSLFGHISYHQCKDHLTAYEQFRFPGDPEGSRKADYCLPSQLVAARVGILLNKK